MTNNRTPPRQSEAEIASLREQVTRLQRTLEQERRQADGLRQDEERFRILSSIATEGVMIHADHVILDANQAFAEILGLESPRELIGRNGMEVIQFTPDSRQQLLAHMRTGSTEAYPIEIMRPDGSILPAEIHGRTIEYQGRQVRLVFMRDISERKRATEALQESERNYREIFNATSDALFIHDETGRIVDVNESMCAMFDCDREWALGRPANELSLGESPYSETEALEMLRQMATRGSHTFLWRSKRRDGELFWSEVALRFCDIGGVKRVIASVRDVSERIRSDAERERLQEQLQHSMKMEAVGRLAGGVAHDFNNLLTVISGNVDLAETEAGTSNPLLPYLEQVSRAAESAAALTRQLLAFSRRQILEPRIIDFNDLVDSVHKLLTRLIGEDIAIETRLDPDLGTVKLDSAQFEQVLVNLAVNARDAMPDGGKLVIETANVDLADSVDCESADLPPGPYVQLTVTDTGHGMTDEVKQHLFEPFFTTKTTGRGTGLGLATIFGSVQQAGGAIEVVSTTPTGTTFRILLPRLHGQAVVPARTELALAMPHGDETVLLVEDDQGVRNLAHAVLSKLGYQVILADSGATAVAQFDAHVGRIDLLLTDLVMPGLDGRQTAQQLSERQPNLRVLYMSGYTDDMVLRQGVVEDDLNFLAKPFDLLTLATRVRDVLDAG